VKKKDLYIFTDSFPFGLGETYVANEISEYYQNFNKIFLIPINLTGTQRYMPANCEVINIHEHAAFSSFNFVKAFPLLCVYFLKELSVTFHKWVYLKNFSNAIKILYNALVYAKALKSIAKKTDENNAAFYTYWFYHWALVCSLAKKNKYIPAYISRAHLGDLYEIKSKLVFTNLKLQSINHLYVISNHGKQFFENNYPKYIQKISVHYLGSPKVTTHDHKEVCNKFLIVSCSSVKPIKRVDEIYQVVCNLQFPVKWVHFGGGGEGFEKLKQLVLTKPGNVDIELKGHVPNTELLKFYETHQIDLFINLSTTEGLPVSIMEAQSFGIPVLATDVFATNEAVVKGTGMLVDNKASVKEIALSVVEIKRQIENKEISNLFILNHWNTHFNAHTNYLKFAEQLNKDE
jgi:glycosyltransferase involved in cell wall biosynthesis